MSEKISLEIPEKCKKCIYKIRSYCDANKAEITTLNVKICKKKVSVYEVNLDEEQLKRLKKMSEKPRVQLAGLDGNAYSIMGRVKKALREAGLEKQIQIFLYEAMSGDYDNLLQVCSKYVEVY